MIKFSQRVLGLVPSPTLQLDAMAKKMARDGHDVINLSVGEPDISTPLQASQNAIEAIRAGHTRYTDVAGIEPLRQALVEHVRERLNLVYETDQVVISNGGKQALYNAFAALINPGDEVLIQAPYWVSYPEQVKLCGGVPVICNTTAENGFKMTAKMLERLVTEKTRILVINSPSNPTGAVYSLRELSELAQFALQHQLIVISDEIYDRLVYDMQGYWSIAQLSPALQRDTIIINGWSKTYGMTGWRLGYSLSSPELAKAMRNIQGHVTANVCSIAQWAAIGALQSREDTESSPFRARRDYLVHVLKSIPGIELCEPGGAFYAFPDLSAFVGRRYRGDVLTSVDDLCARLLADYHVSIVPGSAFGASRHARISYAVELNRLRSAAERIVLFLGEIDPRFELCASE